MAQRRTRDDVWITALTHAAIADKRFTQDRIVQETGASKSTVRETLNVMKDTALIDRKLKPDGSVYYVAGSGLDDD